MKIAAIITAIGVFFGKVFQIIRSAGKLRDVKKEVTGFIKEGKEAWESADVTYKKIQSYFTEDSDGGKRLTANEIKEAVTLLETFWKEAREASVQGLEAKEAIKNLIEGFKKK